MDSSESSRAIRGLKEELELVETLSRLQDNEDFKVFKHHFVDKFQDRYLEQAMFLLEENRKELQEGIIGRSQLVNFLSGNEGEPRKTAEEIKEQIKYLEDLEG